MLFRSTYSKFCVCRRVPCDLWGDLAACFWHFWYFEDFVSCITYVFSVGCESSSPPLRTTFGRCISLIQRPFSVDDGLVLLVYQICTRINGLQQLGYPATMSCEISSARSFIAASSSFAWWS